MDIHAWWFWQLDSCCAFMFSSHWQNNVYLLSLPYVFVTKIHYCSAIRVQKLLFHTDLSELLSCQKSIFRTVGSFREKKKKSVFKDYQWCKKIETWRKKLLPCERGHSGSSVIKGNAALNTRHWILLSKFKPYHIDFSFAQQHSKFIKIFSWESLISSFSFTQFFLPVCFSKTSMVILGLIIGPHLLGPFSLNKIQLGMPAGPSCKGKLTTPMRVLHDMFIARPCTINCMD